MTDNTELKRLAEGATPGPWSVCGEVGSTQGFEIVQDIWNEHGTHTGMDVVVYEWSYESDPLGVIRRPDADFIAAANPAAVLALIADLDEARNGMKYSCAIRLKKEIERLESEAVYSAAGFDAAREEIARLKAEVAGLRTGYEAYERVNAELKAEVEGLRKDVDRASYWKQRAKSAEGHLFSGDFRAAAMELHKYSRFESTPWPELTGSQHALISSAAGAVIATVNRLRDARRPKNRDETDAIIWCACGDGHAANSYGAGFMDANKGVCANCDAAMGNGEQS